MWVFVHVHTSEKNKKWLYFCSFGDWHKLRAIKTGKWNEPRQERGIAYRHLQFLQFCLKVKCSFLGKKKDEKQHQINWNKQQQLYAVSLWGIQQLQIVLSSVISSFIFDSLTLHCRFCWTAACEKYFSSLAHARDISAILPCGDSNC